MHTLTDAELVAAVLSGDKTAFGQLMDRYSEMVRRVSYQRTGDPELAHDLTQETLLQAFLSLDQLREGRYFKSWLYGIAVNVCRMYWRSQRIDWLSLDALVGGRYREPEAHGPSPEEIIEHLELRTMVARVVEQLSPAMREAVMLFYYEGFSLQEAAEALQISVNAMKGRLYKARQQLHTSLIDQPEIGASVRAKEKRRGLKTMIPVKIVDVIRKEKTSETGTNYAHYIIILLDEAGQRAIPIWVGEGEGLAMAIGLQQQEQPAGTPVFGVTRPMTQVFMARLLEASGATLEAVEISALKDEVFYATVKVNAGGTIQEVDARPSDALALAIRMGTPLYASAEVLEQAGIPIATGQKASGTGMRDIMQYLNEQTQAYQARTATTPVPAVNPRDESREVIEAVFA
jgi:RNA polymerase sigma factor (sigma-70 family)